MLEFETFKYSSDATLSSGTENDLQLVPIDENARGSVSIPAGETKCILLSLLPLQALFFECFSGSFSRPQQMHLQTYITGLLTVDDFSLANVATQSVQQPSPAAFTNFVNQSSWDPEEAALRALPVFIKDKQTKPRDDGVFVLDDTIHDIAGPKVEEVSIVKDSKNSRRRGHQLVTIHYKDAKKDYPLLYRLYRQKTLLELSGRQGEFRTKLELAVELITILLNLGVLMGTLVFDSWYCATWFLEFLHYHELRFVSRLKENRTVYWEGEWIKLSELFKLLPSSAFDKTEFTTRAKFSSRRKRRSYWTFRCRLQVKNAGTLTLVLSKTARTAFTGVILVTNVDTLTTREICMLYSYRWTIETFYRDAKQELHLEDARFTTWTSYQRHYYLVFWAYWLLQYLTCYGIIQRQLHTFSRSTRVVKRAFSTFAQETLILRLVRRLVPTFPLQTLKRLLRDPSTWSFFITA